MIAHHSCRNMVWAVAALMFTSSTRLQAEALSPTRSATDGAEMVLVPAGPFTMGSTDGKEDEYPPHRVDLPAFYIDRTEVTRSRYKRFLDATGEKAPINWDNGSIPRGTEEQPVTEVTWFDAMRYAAWAGKRLPSEAEWEKAARGTDGRRYPWGNDDDGARRNKDTEKLINVGAMPAGASPYGCLDMSGNAWEWTTDWYDAYPGSPIGSVHFGRKYKVMRGGGGAYFYGIDNTGRCSQRARLVAYGGHDFLGFRCVQDVDPNAAAATATRLLNEAESQLQATLRKPLKLSFEDEYASFAKAGRVPIRVVGQPGQQGHVRAGFPLPRGAVKEASQLRLIDPQGNPAPLQADVLAPWDDGSVRWACLNFAAADGQTFEVVLKGQGSSVSPRSPARAEQTDGRITITNGSLSLVLTREHLIESVDRVANRAGLRRFFLRLRMDAAGGPKTIAPLPADQMEIEENGPVFVSVRLRGNLGDSDKPAPFRYDLRVQTQAGSPRAHLLLTLIHNDKRVEPLENVAPVINVRDILLRFPLTLEQATESVFGLDHGHATVPSRQMAELSQPDDLQYTLKSEGAKNQKGTRAPGWVAVRSADGCITLGVRHFWQNHAKTLQAGNDFIGVRLWSGSEPFEWEAALAKTHEIILDFAAQPETVMLDPLRITMPRSWPAGTEALGAIMPRTTETISQFPQWELMRENSQMKWVRAMPYGMRDFGDAYMGGPYKGKNAFNNLEYDVHWNYMLQYLRTGHVWYLNAAEAMSRHQADVDTDNVTGRLYKHSPQHTTNEAEFGHVFLRGLLLHYLLTGEHRSLDVARMAGDWMAPKMERGEGTGNERQIGWSLYAITGLYDVTRDPKYLHAALTQCKRLADGQAPTGKFKIRWDNRIAFFNGIAMSGILATYEASGEKYIADSLMKVARRTLGFYPEYACRTLNSYCWIVQQTQDPRFLHNLSRTWESSMEFLMNRGLGGVSEETHSWRFGKIAAQYQLVALFDAPPKAVPDALTWKGLRLNGQRADIFIRAGEREAPLMAVIEGPAKGKVELFDETARSIRVWDFNDDRRFFQAADFTIPPGKTCLLRLTAVGNRGWEIHHDAASDVVVYDPKSEYLTDLCPRAYGFIHEGTKEIKIKFEATGEGFHSATLYNPQGQVVTTLRHFVDFQDTNRYELELKAPVQGETGGWALEVNDLNVLGLEGMTPYWSDSPRELFHPERLAK